MTTTRFCSARSGAAAMRSTARRVATGRDLAAALERHVGSDEHRLAAARLRRPAGAADAQQRASDLPCIVISGTPNEEAAVEALRAGALDFLSKDKPLRFVPAIERALRESAERRALAAAERELRLTEERYRAAFELAPEAIITYDLESGRIIDANASMLRLFGYTKDQFRGLKLGGLSPERQPDGRPSSEAAAEHLERARRGESPMFEWVNVDVAGNLFPAESRLALLPSSGHQLLRVSIVDLARAAAAGGDSPARDRARAAEPPHPGSESAQERVPREHVARAAHAAQRDHRIRRAAARRPGRSRSRRSTRSSSATS